MTDISKQKHVVIIGAGFAGLNSMKSFNRRDVKVTVIDKNNYHTFFPLLYQVGAAEIEPEQIAYPVRNMTRKNRNISFIRSTVESIDTSEKIIHCSGQKIPYDYLITATGSKTGYFNVPGAEQNCFALKTLDHGIILRNHILTSFERANFTNDPDYKNRLLTFIIVGGGPTGVEFAGALSELVHGPLKKDFPEIKIKDISIILIDAADKILGAFSQKLCNYAEKKLTSKGIKVLCNKMVKEVNKKGIVLSDGTVYESSTVIWTAGVKGEPVKADINFPFFQNDRVKTTPYLNLEGHEDIFVAGDLSFFDKDETVLPMIAPVATQQGRHAAKNIMRHLAGKKLVPFKYRDKGIMATIGRNSAVVKIGKFELKGFFAWVIWLLVHIMYLIGFKNRVIVLINWLWNYIFFDKSVRLIMPNCCEQPGIGICFNRDENCSNR